MFIIQRLRNGTNVLTLRVQIDPVKLSPTSDPSSDLPLAELPLCHIPQLQPPPQRNGRLVWRRAVALLALASCAIAAHAHAFCLSKMPFHQNSLPPKYKFGRQPVLLVTGSTSSEWRHWRQKIKKISAIFGRIDIVPVYPV